MAGRPFAPFCDSENDSDDDDGGVSLVASTRQPPPPTKPAVPTTAMKQTTLPGASRVAPKAKQNQQQQQQQQQQKPPTKPQHKQQQPKPSSSLKRPSGLSDATPAKRPKAARKSERSDSEDDDEDDEDDEDDDEEDEETSSEEDVDTGASDENDDEESDSDDHSDDSGVERRAKKRETQRVQNENGSTPPLPVAGVAVSQSESETALQRLRETLSQLQTTSRRPECKVSLERAVQACSDEHKSMERVTNHLIDAVKTFSTMEDEPHSINPHLNRRKLATVVLSNFEITLPKLETFKHDARAQAIAAQELSTKADSLFAAHAPIVDAMACVLKIGSR